MFSQWVMLAWATGEGEGSKPNRVGKQVTETSCGPPSIPSSIRESTQSIHPLKHPSPHPPIHSAIQPLIHLPIHPTFHSSVHPLIHPFTHPFIYLFTHPSIQQIFNEHQTEPDVVIEN